MKFIKDMFTRTDLSHIRQFLLYAEGETDHSNHPYMERLKVGSDPIYNRLKSLYPDKLELDEAVADLSLALAAYESVYMEIGMKSGARLICQLLLSDE